MKDFHQGLLKPAEARACSTVMARAAASTNGVSPGRMFFSPFSARVKMGITAGWRLVDHALNAVRSEVNALNVSRADGDNFARACRYFS